ncbi:hypothetical protein [Winogradskyella sediminis]|uniref:hypothetical protein n=1 Tax=Winogradskyella sediminis TaxID=1382466 RepID=UPI003AA7CF6E
MSDKNKSLEKIENLFLNKLDSKGKKAYELGDAGGKGINKLIDKLVDFLIPNEKK